MRCVVLSDLGELEANPAADETVTNGTVALDVKFMTYITILNKQYPICGSSDVIPCPIQAGPYSRTITELIPGDAPPVSINTLAHLYALRDTRILTYMPGFIQR